MKECMKKRFGDFLKPCVGKYVASVVLAIAGVFFGLVPYYIAYRLLIGLPIGYSYRELSVGAFLILAFFVLQLLTHNASTAISHKTAFRILEEVRGAITDKMLRLPLGGLQVKGSGHFLHMLIDGTERLEYPLAHAIPETTSSVLLPLGIVSLLFAVDWRMALSVLVPAALTLLVYLPMYIGIMNEFANTYYASLERMNEQIIEYIRGNKEIRIFGQEERSYGRYTEAIRSYESSTLKLYHRMHAVAAPAMVILSSILVAVLCTGGVLYAQGQLSGHVFLISVLLSIGIGASLLKFTEFMDNFYHIKNGKRLINSILSVPELRDGAQEAPKSNRIELHSVSFAYEKEPVLRDVSLVFEEKQKVAIVGPSGAGKTTVANLLARFWDVTGGSITLGGVDYRDLSLSALISRISYITQDTFLFNLSVMENIRLGDPTASDAQVMEAARQAQCAEFIETLDDGYHTMVGNDGMRLSAGQRQRIVIARAILKNTPILILDEATAYTDMENQHKIQASLQALCRDKTLIIIAHRLTTVTGCDQIVVLEDGEVRAVGTHEELLGYCVLYRNIWAFHQSGQAEEAEVISC